MLYSLLTTSLLAGVVGLSPLPDYSLTAPVQRQALTQDALILQATQRWYLIDKGSIMKPSERLWQLLRTRPILQARRIDGSLFVEILVSRGGYAIIADGLASLLCTQLGPAKEIPKNSYWYDRPVWQIQLEITADWAGKWKPLGSKAMLKGVDPLHAVAWRNWVKPRIGKPALKAHPPKQRKASEGEWGYKALAGGNTGRAIVRAAAIAHQIQIQELEAQATALDLSWRRRYSRLYVRWLHATDHLTWIDCKGRAVAQSYTSDAQYRHCKEVMSDTLQIEAALKEHKATRTKTYRHIRQMRQAIERAKRGLAEAKAALEVVK